jgi:hypothetical protein
MHSGLCVCGGRLALSLFSVVGGLGFEWGGEVESVHEAAGVEPVDLRAGPFFELFDGGDGAFLEGGSVFDAFVFVEAD